MKMSDSDPYPEMSKYVEKDIVIDSEYDDMVDSDEKSIIWNGTEAELVCDDDPEQYDDNSVGVKISYTLEKENIFEFIQNSARYIQKLKEIKKYMFFQGFIIIFFVLIFLLTSNVLYGLASLISILTGIAVYVIPKVSLKRIVNSVYDNVKYDVEVFPDKIEVLHNGQKRVYLLDESEKYKITKNLIIVYSKNKETLIIPISVIEPDFLSDVQAMISAGAQPI